MTLQQLQGFCAVVDCDLRVSLAAEALHTTQPAVSKMLRAIEQTVGAPLFVRRGNRLQALTDEGREALALARQALACTRDIAAIGDPTGGLARRTLRVATTHIHARYALMPAMKRFSASHPAIDVALAHGTAAQIVDWVERGAADLGVSTLPTRVPRSIATLPTYTIERCVIVPTGHPLARSRRLTLEALAAYPLIAYDEQHNTGQIVRQAFRERGLSPRILLRTVEADTIKAYVAAGLGVAVIHRTAVDPARDVGLRIVESGSLFPSSLAHMTLRRDRLVRAHVRDFIGMVDARWAGAALDEALRVRP